jgi:K+-transporting ATPase ATPase C chain
MNTFSTHLRANLWLLVLTLLICAVLYPLVLWGIGQAIFPHQAQGSLLTAPDGQPVGSRLIAQPFSSDDYFHPRPSAVSYNAAATGGSNWGAANPALRKRVEEEIAKLRKENPTMATRLIPADLVTTSGSGLDPHLTLKAALYQLDRVADAWAKRTGADTASTRAEIERLLRDNAHAPLGGLAGAPLVNVLEVNLELRERLRLGGNSRRASVPAGQGTGG